MYRNPRCASCYSFLLHGSTLKIVLCQATRYSKGNSIRILKKYFFKKVANITYTAYILNLEDLKKK